MKIIPLFSGKILIILILIDCVRGQLAFSLISLNLWHLTQNGNYVVDDCGIIANHYITASSSKVQTIKMTWQRFYKSSTNSPSENWTKPLKGTLSTSEINRKTKASILMSPPFAHSQKYVIFVSACVTRLIVTGLSWAFKIIAPSARTEPHSVKEYRSLQKFWSDEFAIENDLWRPERRCSRRER